MSRLLIFCINMSPFSLRGTSATLKCSDPESIFFLYVFHFSIRTKLFFLYFVFMCPLLAYAGHALTLERSDAQNIFFDICSISVYPPLFFINLTRIVNALNILYLYVPFLAMRATRPPSNALMLKYFFLICLPFQYTHYTSIFIFCMYVSPFSICGPRAHP